MSEDLGCLSGQGSQAGIQGIRAHGQGWTGDQKEGPQPGLWKASEGRLDGPKESGRVGSVRAGAWWWASGNACHGARRIPGWFVCKFF